MSTSPSKHSVFTKRNVLLAIGAAIAAQLIYAAAIQPFAKQANYFNRCMEIQEEAYEEDGGKLKGLSYINAVSKCNGGR